MKTFENEEVGVLTDHSTLTVLFHINQVWINHPSMGFVNFREIYPKSDLSKLLYPGRQVKCWARQITALKVRNGERIFGGKKQKLLPKILFFQLQFRTYF